MISQPVFDALCPPESSKSRRRLCVVLISGNGGGSSDESDEDGKRQALRDFIADTNFPRERVRFAYVLEEKQADFVSSLVNGEHSVSSDAAPSLKAQGDLAIVWRRESHSVRFQVFLYLIKAFLPACLVGHQYNFSSNSIFFLEMASHHQWDINQPIFFSGLRGSGRLLMTSSRRNS